MKVKGIQAKFPTNATNLSRLSEPPQAMSAHRATMKNRNIFFCHLMYGLYFPLFVNSAFSVILIAGKICNGVDNRMARE